MYVTATAPTPIVPASPATLKPDGPKYVAPVAAALSAGLTNDAIAGLYFRKPTISSNSNCQLFNKDSKREKVR